MLLGQLSAGAIAASSGAIWPIKGASAAAGAALEGSSGAAATFVGVSVDATITGI